MATGVRVVNKMPQWVDERKRVAARAINQAIVLGASEAASMTPIDTSTLINSQIREIREEGSKVVGVAGYTAAYALPVHDPDNKQTFRRAGAQKEFLKRGFQRQAGRIRAIVLRGMKG